MITEMVGIETEIRRYLFWLINGMMLVMALPQAAMACVINAVTEVTSCTVHPNTGICMPQSARERRFSNYLNWRSERGRWRIAADAGLADPSRNYAADLVRTMIPLVRPAYAQETSCGLEPAERDPAGYLDDRLDYVWPSQQVGTTLTEQSLRSHRLRDLIPNRSAHHDQCNAEYRARALALLDQRHARTERAAVWHKISRRGILRPAAREPGMVQGQATLLAFAGPERSGALGFGRTPFAYRPGDHRWPLRVRAEFEALQTFFGRNRAGRAVMATLTSFAASDQLQRQDDLINCPVTAAQLAENMAVVRAALAAQGAQPPC